MGAEEGDEGEERESERRREMYRMVRMRDRREAPRPIDSAWNAEQVRKDNK